MDINYKNNRKKNRIDGSDMLMNLPVAMVYMPVQRWRDIYKTDTALAKGTIFAELFLPFCGKGAV